MPRAADSRTTDWPALAVALGRDGYARQAFAVRPGPEAAFIAAHMDLPAGSLIADVGCGPGRHLVEWCRLGLRVVGLDVALAFRPPVVADAVALPLVDDAVDAVVALGVAPYVGLRTLLAELTRVARRVVVVSTFNVGFVRRHMGIEGTVVDEQARLPGGEVVEHVHDCHDPGDLPGIVYGVEPGSYAAVPPSDDLPELLSFWRVAPTS